LLHDQVRRQALARAGRALVESQYGWDRISVDMEDAWRSAAAFGPLTSDFRPLEEPA